MNEITRGLHYGLPASTYHADPCPEPSLSSSVGRVLIERSPAHARLENPRLNPDYERSPPTVAMALGAAAHEVALLEDWSRIAFVDARDWRTKAAKEERAGAIMHGHTPLLEKYRQQVEDIVAAVLDSRVLPAVRSTEVSAFWTETDGIWCRARFDCLDEERGQIVDLKTTAIPATAEGWGRRMIWNYALQCGLYRRGYAALHDGRLPGWTFFVQEVQPPYAWGVFEYDEEALMYCDGLADEAVNRWAECVRSGQWPAYPAGVHRMALPYHLTPHDDEIEA